jgi:hypothetical protein
MDGYSATHRSRSNSLDSIPDSNAGSLSPFKLDSRRGIQEYPDGFFVWSTQMSSDGVTTYEEHKPIWVPKQGTLLDGDEINSRRSEFMSIFNQLTLAERDLMEDNVLRLPSNFDPNVNEMDPNNMLTGLLRSLVQVRRHR